MLFGLMFVALGGFFSFALIAGERAPSAPILARFAAGAIAAALLAAGALMILSALRAPKP